jgi:hypothetical protein
VPVRCSLSCRKPRLSASRAACRQRPSVRLHSPARIDNRNHDGGAAIASFCLVQREDVEGENPPSFSTAFNFLAIRDHFFKASCASGLLGVHGGGQPGRSRRPRQPVISTRAGRRGARVVLRSRRDRRCPSTTVSDGHALFVRDRKTSVLIGLRGGPGRRAPAL